MRFARCAILPYLFVLSGCGLTDEPGCVETFCGCWEEVSIEFTTTVRDGKLNAPVDGATLTCVGEDDARCTSDASGAMMFTLVAQESPGCGLDSCNRVIIAAEGTGLLPRELPYHLVLNEVVTLESSDD
jgi:hypothetical protein